MSPDLGSIPLTEVSSSVIISRNNGEIVVPTRRTIDAMSSSQDKVGIDNDTTANESGPSRILEEDLDGGLEGKNSLVSRKNSRAGELFHRGGSVRPSFDISFSELVVGSCSHGFFFVESVHSSLEFFFVHSLQQGHLALDGGIIRVDLLAWFVSLLCVTLNGVNGQEKNDQSN